MTLHAHVHGMADAFQFIESFVNDLNEQRDESDLEATQLQKRVDELEAEVADLKAQIKAWEEA